MLRASRHATNTCWSCHSDIGPGHPDDGAAVRPVNCAACHADQSETYGASVHGRAGRLGSTRAANCASCHGVHLILPSSDPRSSIHPDNLVHTCGHCHPGATQGFVAGRVHTDLGAGADLGSVVNRWVRRIYLVLIVTTIGVLATHNLLHWWRRAALVLVGLGGYHVLYVLLSARGRALLRDLLPARRDVHELQGALRYLTGRGPRARAPHRFGYVEKFEYWAVVWGTAIMGLTGFVLWFPVAVSRWLPRWVVDVALTIHYYEAILACLAVLVWHFSHVIFDPDVYPLNWAFWTGRRLPPPPEAAGPPGPAQAEPRQQRLALAR